MDYVTLHFFNRSLNPKTIDMLQQKHNEGDNGENVTAVQPSAQRCATVTFRSHFLDSIDISIAYGIIIKNKAYVTLQECFM